MKGAKGAEGDEGAGASLLPQSLATMVTTLQG